MDKNFDLESLDPELFKRVQSSKSSHEAERKTIIEGLKGNDLEIAQAAENGVQPRSKVGHNFSRSSIGQGEAYKKLSNREAKARFRTQWAKTQLAGLVSSKIRQTIIKESWKSRAQYIPFFKIIEKEGSDDAGIEAAKNHVRKCIEYGGEFLRENPMTGRIDFLWISFGKEESMDEIWELKSTESSSSEPDTKKQKMLAGSSSSKADGGVKFDKGAIVIEGSPSTKGSSKGVVNPLRAEEGKDDTETNKRPVDSTPEKITKVRGQTVQAINECVVRLVLLCVRLVLLVGVGGLTFVWLRICCPHPERTPAKSSGHKWQLLISFGLAFTML